MCDDDNDIEEDFPFRLPQISKTNGKRLKVLLSSMTSWCSWKKYEYSDDCKYLGEIVASRKLWAGYFRLYDDVQLLHSLPLCFAFSFYDKDTTRWCRWWWLCVVSRMQEYKIISIRQQLLSIRSSLFIR